jgi:hypothetical protein
MPARNGTGPSGQGPQTGRGLGNCSPSTSNTREIKSPTTRQPYGLGRRILNGIFGQLFGRRRGQTTNRK